jgi:hypothetical protein
MKLSFKEKVQSVVPNAKLKHHKLYPNYIEDGYTCYASDRVGEDENEEMLWMKAWNKIEEELLKKLER